MDWIPTTSYLHGLNWKENSNLLANHLESFFHTQNTVFYLFMFIIDDSSRVVLAVREIVMVLLRGCVVSPLQWFPSHSMLVWFECADRIALLYHCNWESLNCIATKFHAVMLHADYMYNPTDTTGCDGHVYSLMSRHGICSDCLKERNVFRLSVSVHQNYGENCWSTNQWTETLKRCSSIYSGWRCFLFNT